MDVPSEVTRPPIDPCGKTYNSLFISGHLSFCFKRDMGCRHGYVDEVVGEAKPSLGTS